MKDRDSFNISDLAESKEFTEFFTILRQLTGIVVGLTSPDGTIAKLLCPETEFPPLCKLILSSPEGRKACEMTNRLFCGKASRCKHGIHYFCHAGLIDFVVPIYLNDWQIASINGGQILIEKPSEKGFKILCEKIKSVPVDTKELHNVYFKSPYMSQEKLEAVLKLISHYADYFCETGYRLHPSGQNKNSPKIFAAVKYLKEHSHDDITLTEIASNVGLCDTYFSRLFTKMMGIPYTHYLNKLRLDEAKKLLKTTDRTITQIAFDVGFNSLPYFNQIFNKSEKCSPRKYRKQLHQKIKSKWQLCESKAFQARR